MLKRRIFILTGLCLLTAPGTIPAQGRFEVPAGMDPLGTQEAIRTQVEMAAERLGDLERIRQEQTIQDTLQDVQSLLEGGSDSRSLTELPEQESESETVTEEEMTEEEPLTEALAETESETQAPQTEEVFSPVPMGKVVHETSAEPETAQSGSESETKESGSESEAAQSGSESETKESGSESEAAQSGPETKMSESETETEPGAAGELSDEERLLTGLETLSLNHGMFEVPSGILINEARINPYDYRMLREYPLARLPVSLGYLKDILEKKIAEYDGIWSVYIQDLSTGQEVILSDRAMHSASVMKLFIMEAVYEAFDEGKLERNEETVYLLRSMIVNSSNESSNRLLQLLGEGDLKTGVDTVNEFIRTHAFSGETVIYNGFQDPAATVNPGYINSITAKDVGRLLERVYRREFLSRRVCAEIEQMMLDQATRYKIPKGLPEGVSCGNKTGETSDISNDSAVIYGRNTDYVLVVLSNDWSDQETANVHIQEISRLVYNYLDRPYGE